MLLLDTNALLWALNDDPRLSDAAGEHIEQAWAIGAVAVSAVTFWEVALLVERQRLALSATPAAWRQERIGDGLVELPLHGEEVLRAVRLGQEGFHRDPADRFIVATALVGGHTLVTSDQQILAWPGHLPRVDSRGVGPAGTPSPTTGA